MYYYLTMTIGQRIKKLRLERRISQTELASRIGVHQVAISQLEGDVVKGTTYVASLAHILGVNALWLETGQGKPDVGYSPLDETTKNHCKEIDEVIRLMESTDDRGRRKALIAVEDVVEAHLARKNSLPRAQQPEEDEADYVNRLAQEALPEIIESEKLANDVYMPDNGGARKDKRH